MGSPGTTAQSAYPKAGGGGGGGAQYNSGNGAGGGGGGGMGSFANPPGSGNPGGSGSPATYSNVPVTPGGSYPITVTSPGSVKISWCPQ